MLDLEVLLYKRLAWFFRRLGVYYKKKACLKSRQSNKPGLFRELRLYRLYCNCWWTIFSFFHLVFFVFILFMRVTDLLKEGHWEDLIDVSRFSEGFLYIYWGWWVILHYEYASSVSSFFYFTLLMLVWMYAHPLRRIFYWFRVYFIDKDFIVLYCWLKCENRHLEEIMLVLFCFGLLVVAIYPFFYHCVHLFLFYLFFLYFYISFCLWYDFELGDRFLSFLYKGLGNLFFFLLFVIGTFVIMEEWVIVRYILWFLLGVGVVLRLLAFLVSFFV